MNYFISIKIPNKTLSAIMRLTLCCFFLAACNRQPKETAAPDQEQRPPVAKAVTLTQRQAAGVGIRWGGMEERNLSNLVRANGILDVPPQHRVTVHALLGGYLKSTSLLEGMHVHKGEEIAVLENPAYIDIQQSYLENTGKLAFLEQEYARQKELQKEDVTSAKNLQRAEAEYRGAFAAVKGLEAKLQMLGISKAEVLAGRLTSQVRIKAPIDGYVTRMNTNVGKFVNEQDILFDLVNTQHMHLELRLFEKDLARIHEGSRIRFRLAADSMKEHTATVHLIGRALDETRSVRVHGHLDREAPSLLPGLFVTAFIETDSIPRKAHALPEQALVREGESSFIFVLMGEKGEGDARQYVFHRFEIKEGRSEDNYVEIIPLQTLPANARIVTKGAYYLLAEMNKGQAEE